MQLTHEKDEMPPRGSWSNLGRYEPVREGPGEATKMIRVMEQLSYKGRLRVRVD